MEVRTKKQGDQIPKEKKPEVLRKRIEGLDDRITLDISELPHYDPEAVALAMQALRKRKVAWEQEKIIKEITQEANQQIQIALDLLGVSSIKDKEFGTGSWVSTSRQTLDKNRLQESLLKRGIPADIVKECMDEASKTSNSSYVRYTPPKA